MDSLPLDFVKNLGLTGRTRKAILRKLFLFDEKVILSDVSAWIGPWARDHIGKFFQVERRAETRLMKRACIAS
jgi:hypothetical protein